ncbi:hypothetical protein [Viscerimonas tarda]
MANEVKIYDTVNTVDSSIVDDFKTIIRESKEKFSCEPIKISNTHFRLGSKIHITDFYYAKPYFQESKNASNYAKIIAKDIENNPTFKDTINKKSKTFLSIIGYGLYSELLVSYIKDELIKDALEINTNTVSDTEDFKFNKPDSEIYENVVIVVPIATTFSTSIKMERVIRQKYKEQGKEGINIIQPYYNILAVLDNTFDKWNTGEELPPIFTKYGWEDIDKTKQIITTNGLSQNQKVRQRFYFHLPTSWQSIDECEKCFPDGNSECEKGHKECLRCKKCCAKKEIPLFYTDNTSLTPELIIDSPVARVINNNRKLEIDISQKPTIRYGHIKRNENHYHYYFNDYAVWENNKQKVVEWLSTHTTEKEDSNKYVILAPGHFSNAEFVEMVNKVVFSNQAIIIHYDPTIKNPQLFDYYYKISQYEEANLYYVDDVVTSGSTLCEADLLIKRIIKPEKKFTKCFFFVNRSGFYEDKDIRGVCEKIYAFADLHLPYIKSQYNICPLCSEKKKYEKLIENSYLTRVKLYFIEKMNKLTILEINDSKIPNAITDKKKTSIPLRVEANHRIYELFQGKENKGKNTGFEESCKETFEDWFINYLLTNTTSPFETSYFESKESSCYKEGCILSEREIAVLKNLTQTPFYNYKNIRKKTFNWVIELLEEKVDKWNENNQITNDSFKELKFLIRRATLLNSNYIISYKLLHLIQQLYKSIKDDDLRGFSKFFTAQVNELLHKDEARSIELNIRLKYFEEIQNNPPLFKQLIRMLREENAAVIRTFAEFFEKEWNNSSEIEPSFSVKSIDIALENIEAEIKKCLVSFEDKYLYKLMLKMINSENDLTEKELNEVTKFLTLRILLRDSINDKTDNLPDSDQEKFFSHLFNGLNDIVGSNGCFAIVKYKQSEDEPYYLLHNQGNNNDTIHNIMGLSFLNNLLAEGKSPANEGNKQDSISITEFHYDGNKWTDLFDDETNKTTQALSGFILPNNNNRLLLLRIDNDTVGKDNKGEYQTEHYGQALIGFYYHCENKELTDIKRIRYLLLLRNDISKYLKKIVEKSGTFRDYVEKKENQRKFEKIYLDSDHSFGSYEIEDKIDLDELETTNLISVYRAYFSHTNMIINHIYSNIEQNHKLTLLDMDSLPFVKLADIFDEKNLSLIQKGFRDKVIGHCWEGKLVINTSFSDTAETRFHKQILRAFVIQCLDNAMYQKHLPSDKKTITLSITDNLITIKNDFTGIETEEVQKSKDRFTKIKNYIKELKCKNYSHMTLTALQGYCDKFNFECDYKFDSYSNFIVTINLNNSSNYE